MLHQLNIGIHVLFGTIAMVIGFFALINNQKAVLHKKLGRYFLRFFWVVIATGFVGYVFFRNNPFLLMLSLIAGYVAFAGYRNIQLRETRSSGFDVAVALTALVTSTVLVFNLRSSGEPVNVTVTSTWMALIFVTGYDLIKYFFLHRIIKGWWLYEHIYKMISAFSALASAFSGNVLRDYHPYSQLGPSVLCTLLIIWFIAQRAVRGSKASAVV